jgi:signal transduction histidine kinase
LGGAWIYTACGLARIAQSQLRSWMDAAERGQRTPLAVAVYDRAAGVNSQAFVGSYLPHVAKSPDGRVWFATELGVGMVDPRRLAQNSLVPPVIIQELTAERRLYPTASDLHLPPLIHDLEIGYTALSLVAPQKNQFRYKLEGRDRDWQNVGNRRQAFYSDLPPGNYRFHVIASNNSGVWNNQGDTLDFTIAPAYWQTSWFRALCALALLALLWVAYLLRMRQLKYAFNMRLEARMGERMRIARDLHDTLLQSFQGLLLRFQTVAAMLPARPEEAKEVVLSAVDQAAQAITEGRRAVQGLRQADETSDFATDLRTAGELAARESANESVTLLVEVEGSPRKLHPLVRDEIYRIACEALRNAFRHARARRREVELEYQERQLRLRVRDDGQGVDPKILEVDARTDHFGLHGMRERAKLIEGQLEVWSAPAKGTEVELTIPASRAYAAE